MRNLFGTDGVRGKANVPPMTPETALALGQAIAHYFGKEKSAHRIIIGKDTRRSSYMLELAIAAGVCSMGSTAIFTGPLPTPGVAYLTKAMLADAGVMISASHNAFDDNGIKFFDHEGFKLSDEIELELERFIDRDPDTTPRPTGLKIGKAYRIEDAQGRYTEAVKRTFPRKLTLDGLKVVIDCANGAAYKLAPAVLWELGAEVIPFSIEPNGSNINENCGALFPDHMRRLVLKHGAHVGIALDGDADRLILCDEHGDIIDGDKVLALCALELAQEEELRHKRVVGTILTNMGVENYLREHGVELLRTAVGDRYIIEEMRKGNLSLGGEPSGHLIFSKHATTGDGLIAGLQVLASMRKSSRPLSELTAAIPLYPQVSENIRVKSRPAIETVRPVMDAIELMEKRLKNKGRAVVRYSGTEPVLRLMLEGQDVAVIREELGKLAQIITQNMA